MGRAKSSGGSSTWKGVEKKRCGVEGCKKRAKHFSDEINLCGKHYKNNG